MSVEIEGTAGYDQQYKASALIGLLFLGEKETLVVEPIDEEDATLLRAAGTTEVQSKASQTQVTAEVLSDWLLHFPSRKSYGSLIERLVTGPDRHAVIVCGGRCADAIGALSARWATAEQPLVALDSALIAALRAALMAHASALAASAKVLAHDRGTAARNWLDGLSDAELRDAIQRLRIVDNVDRADLDDRIRSRLIQKYRVPSTRAHACALEIDAAIREARDRRGDAWPAIQRILRAYENTPAFPPDRLGWYVKRGQEEAFMASIRARHVLLLTGLSGCGKTWTARWIAEKLRMDGFAFRESGDFRTLSAVMFTPDNDTKLLFVDDPEELRKSSGHRQLRAAIEATRAHRLLIVTSTRDVVERLYGTSDPRDWRTDDIQWIDLTIHDPDLLRRALAASGAAPESQRRLDVMLSMEVDIPQFDLVNAFRNANGRLVDSVAFAIGAGAAVLRESISPMALRVASCIALGADQTTRMPSEALNWILSDDDNLPGRLPDHNWRGASFGGPKIPSPEFPKWPVVTPPAATSGALDELTQMGWIETDAVGTRFTHPRFVRAATFTAGGEARWLSTARRATASLHPQGAVLALRRLADAIDQELVGERWVAVAVSALRSLFPRVRDAAAQLLGRHFGALSADAVQQLFRSVDRSQQDEDDLLFHGDSSDIPWWIRNEPWLDPRQDRNAGESLLDRFRRPTAQALESLRTVGALPPPCLAYKLAQAAVLGEVKLSAEELDKLLGSPDRFVREEAVRARVVANIPLSDELLDLIFDDHPAVLGMALQAVFVCEAQLSGESLERWVSRMADALERPVVALAATFVMEDLHDAVRYGTRLHAEAVTLGQWRLWGRLAPHWLRGLPPELDRIRQGRLWSTAKEALGLLEAHQVVAIAEAWIRYYERCAAEQICLIDSYGLGVVEFLVLGTDAAARGGVLVKLLGHTIEQLRWTAIAESLGAWSELSAVERRAARAALAAKGSDAVWRKLLVFERSSAPELHQQILGDARLITASAAEIVDRLPLEVLCAGLRQHFGLQVPGDPDWYSGSDPQRWLSIVEELVVRPAHPAYIVAVDALLQTNPLTRRPVWARCLAAAGPAERELLAQRLLCWSILITNSNLRDEWGAWWDSSDEAARQRALFAVIENVEALSTRNDLEGVFHGSLRNAIWKFLPSDLEAMRVIERLKDGEIGVSEVTRRLDASRPRTKWCVDLLRFATGDRGPDPVTATISVLGAAVIDRGKAQREHWRALRDTSYSPKGVNENETEQA